MAFVRLPISCPFRVDCTVWAVSWLEVVYRKLTLRSDDAGVTSKLHCEEIKLVRLSSAFTELEPDIDVLLRVILTALKELGELAVKVAVQDI